MCHAAFFAHLIPAGYLSSLMIPHTPEFLREQKKLTTSLPFAVVVDPDLDASKVRLGWPLAGGPLGDFIVYIGPGATLSEHELKTCAEAQARHPHADSVLAVAAGGQPRRRRKPRHRR